MPVTGLLFIVYSPAGRDSHRTLVIRDVLYMWGGLIDRRVN